jgi:hypothetical protein
MDGTMLSSHKRDFGSAVTKSLDPAPQLKLLSVRPGGWRNSVLRDKMPRSVVDHLDSVDKDTLRRDLKLLYEAAQRSGLDATLDALDILAEEHADFPDFFQVGVLAGRIADLGLAQMEPGHADLSVYDATFLEVGANDK